MILRGRVVEYHNIATDLKFPEFILYKPQSGGCVEVVIVILNFMFGCLFSFFFLGETFCF